MLIDGFPAAFAGTNCFVVAPAAGEQCVIVDPGVGVTGQLDELIAEHRLHPVAVLLTHGHLDHTFSVLPVCQAKDVPAYIHSSDRYALADPWANAGVPKGQPLFGLESIPAAEPSDVVELADGAVVEIAGLHLTIRHAPGHTSGSVMFDIADPEHPSLLSGDVLFAGSIGRTDLPTGSMADMARSLRDVVLTLPDDLVVYPGHGPRTTIGAERSHNPYLTDAFLASELGGS